jgi:hypothetical protein
MKLYAILTRNQLSGNAVDRSLAAAAVKRGLGYEHIVVEDTVLQDVPKLQLEDNALVYRIAANNPKASAIESALVYFQPGKITTIYKPKTVPLAHAYVEMDEQLAAGLNLIPTQIVDPTWLEFSDAELDARINALDGLPLIIKTLGESHGQGVERAETRDVVREKIQSGLATGRMVLARKYLADYKNYRLIVVDGEVVAALEYHKPADDFRTNATDNVIISPLVVSELEPKMKELAIKAVELRASLLGGIDILIDEATGIAYMAEVNIPCNYARVEGPTNIDISSQIINAMLKRAA